MFGTQNMVGRSYFDWLRLAPQPNLTTVLTYDSDSSPAEGDGTYINPLTTPGWHPDYRKMRFGLCSALLGDGFFAYDFNTAGHGKFGLLWFDEFDNTGRGRGYLGKPLGAQRLALPPLATPDSLGGKGSFATAAQVNIWSASARPGYAVTRGFDAGTAKVTVSTSAGEPSRASFYYRSVAVQAKSTYTLTFRAHADRPTTITARVAKDASPHTTWMDFGRLAVGTSWKTYEISLPSVGSDTAALLIFGVGERMGTLWFDNVKLQPGSRLDVHRRDFERGVVVVNATGSSRTVPLSGTFRRLKGTQAPSVNDGRYVSSVTLPARDGLVLLRTPTLSLLGAASINAGSTKTLSGTLKGTTGSFLANSAVVLQSSSDQVNWKSVGTRTTSSTGTFAFTVKPSNTTYYRARYYGNSVELEATSPTVRVAVIRVP